MRPSELIAHVEGLVATARDFHRGASAVADTAPKVAQNVADAMTKLGRENAVLKRENGRLVLEAESRRQTIQGLLDDEKTPAAKMKAVVDTMRVANGRLNAEACDLRTQATKDRREIVGLRGKLKDAERRVEAHRETIRGYFEQLGAEARQGNPDGKATSSNTDGQ